MGEKKNRKFKDHVSNKNSVCYVNKIRSYHLTIVVYEGQSKYTKNLP